MASIAPLVAAWRRRMANLPGPLAGSGEASNGEPVTVELLVAGVWVDITSYCLVRDNSGNISITSGIRGEGSQTERAQAGLELANTDGRFSPRNPVGDYFDALNWRNDQIRISVPDGTGGKSYRIWGEASEWIPNWDSTGRDVWTDVTVNGIIQRLAQGPVPERSVIYRAVAEPPLDSLVAYWPCEDPAGSTRLASGLVNGAPMTFTGSPALASYEGFGASDPLPTLAGASLKGNAEYDATSVTRYQMRFLLAVPDGGFSDLDVISRLRVAEVAAGVSLLNYFDIHYNDPPGGVGAYGAPGTLSIQSYDGDEATVGAGASISLDVRGRHLRVSLENSISSTTMTVTLRVLDINSGVTDSASYTISSTSMSRVMSMTLAPATLSSSAGVTGAAAGHLSLQTTITDINDLGRAIQPTGEAAARRIQRLCGEEGIAFEWIGHLDNTVALGAQGKQNLLTLVQEAVQADGGLLYETTDVLGLGYRTRTSLYNQDPALTLSYSGYNLNEVPVPVTDDRYVQNRVVVTVGGVSQTYEKLDGPLGTATIGVYGETSGVTLNLATTDEATIRSHAAWLVHLGTVEDERFPQISVNLAHPSITPEMRRAILALRPGDRIQVTGMPQPWMAPDTVDQLYLGASQTISHFEHRLQFACAPASPYSIGVLNAALAKADTDGSRLAAGATSGATSLSVEVTDGPLWTTDPAKFPFDIRVGGEVMTVTAISGASSPQTFTLGARSVNGVTKAQAAGIAVRLDHPTTIALGGDPMAYPDILAGDDITAGLLTSMLPIIKPKAVTEPVTASTAMQNDDELFSAVSANATYSVMLHLFHDAATAADITIGWAGPAGATMNWGAVVAHVNETSSGTVANVSMQTRIISEVQDIGGGASTGTYSVVHGTLITSSTAGTLNFQWAQRVSSATPTNVRAGSMLILHRSA